MDREGFSDALRQARERKGLHQDQLATALGLKSQSAVSGWESGKSLPQPEDVFRVESCLDLDPGTLSRHLGYVPAGELTPGVEVAIRADDHLPPRLRDQLVAIYYALRWPASSCLGDGRGPSRLEVPPVIPEPCELLSSHERTRLAMCVALAIDEQEQTGTARCFDDAVLRQVHAATLSYSTRFGLPRASRFFGQRWSTLRARARCSCPQLGHRKREGRVMACGCGRRASCRTTC